MTEAHQQDEAVSNEALRERAAKQLGTRPTYNIHTQRHGRERPDIEADTALALLFKVIAHPRLDGLIEFGAQDDGNDRQGLEFSEYDKTAEPGRRFRVVTEAKSITTRTLIQVCVEALESVEDKP